MGNLDLSIKKVLVFSWNGFVDTILGLANGYFIIRDRLLMNIYRKPIIKSMDETIDTIIKHRSSVARFGDGEFKLMIGKNIAFQNCTKEMRARLKEVLKNGDRNIIVCIPDIFDDLSIFDSESANYWKLHIAKNRIKWYSLLNLKKDYYNSFISRFYYGFKDKSSSWHWLEKIKLIWQDRDIVIIEGNKSRLGVGNDLFHNARTVNRILCPERNAFYSYNAILAEARKTEKEKLILLALGPTATILAYDLNTLGYQAVDIGHIDIEYEWLLMGATKKEKVRGKYVGEVLGGTMIEDCQDTDYLRQIVATVK